MATIAWFVDVEEGHVLSTIKLAKQLAARGHRVCYVGIADAEPLVTSQGFEFMPVLQSVMPAGFRAGLRTRFGTDPERAAATVKDLYFETLVSGALLDRVFDELKPSVLLINSLFSTEAIAIRYRYRVPVVLVTSSYFVGSRRQRCRTVIQDVLSLKGGVTDLLDIVTKAGAVLRNFTDLAELVLAMPELLLLPRSFDEPGRDDPNCHHVGALVDLDRTERPCDWGWLSSSRRLVYASLGSQPDLEPAVSSRFFQMMVDAFAPSDDWALLLAVGHGAAAPAAASLPPHVQVQAWVPQIQALRRATVMVNHAGIGTVRECILLGVPMIVCPLGRDQFDCASRVTATGIGLDADARQIDAAGMRSLVERVADDRDVAARLAAMRAEFERAEREQVGVDVIERAMGAAHGGVQPAHA